METHMPDDPTKRGAEDRREASMQDHEVRNIAHKFNVTPEVVRKTIERVGNSREKVEAALRTGER
jgi:hypothetical protein